MPVGTDQLALGRQIFAAAWRSSSSRSMLLNAADAWMHLPYLRLEGACAEPSYTDGPARASPACRFAGCVRLGSTAAAGYDVDASEYGQHWNFFFTLGALELLTMAAPQDPASAGASGASWYIACQSSQYVAAAAR